MLEPLLASELAARGHADISFQRLQPVQDATGYYPDGGWTRVVGWCLANAEDNFEVALSGPLANVPDLDAILIHIDGDAAAHLVPHTSAQRPASWTASTRVQFITSAVEDWLKLDTAMRGRVIIAAPVQQTEAWMNAAVRSVLGPYETHEAKTSFRARMDPSGQAKPAAYYGIAGISAGNHRSLISERCISYRRFQDEIERSHL
jgi:hypothetical protein